MKNTIHAFLLSLSFLTLFTTCKNPGIDYDTFSIVEENIQPGTRTVMISGKYSFLGEVKNMKIEIGLDDQLVHAESHSMNLDNQNFSATIDNLTPGTSYHYCYVAEFDNNHKLLTEVSNFATLPISDKPVVRTLEVKYIDSVTFLVKCIVDEDFGMGITERGICWNTTGNPSLDDNHVAHQENGLGEYSCQITGLELNTTYFVRAYAKNEVGPSYANEILGFKTDAFEKPTVETLPIDINEITQTKAVCSGRIVNEGSSPVIERGIYWGASPEPDINWTYTQSNSNENDFVAILTDLTHSTTYYFCAYAINNEGRGCGDIIEFTTLDQNKFRIEVSCSPNSGGQVEGEGEFVEGDVCELKAIANDHYDFKNWTEGEQILPESDHYSFTVDRNRTLVANFAIKTYTISGAVNPIDGGTVSGAGTFEYGSTCILTAFANEYFEFENWADYNGNEVSSQNPYLFNVTGDRELVANFKALPQVPEGGIDALFSVGPSSKVYFSQGNLRYHARYQRWSFADKQYEHIGESNSNISPNYDGWIDLFGWGTGSEPTNTSTNYQNYGVFSDWGNNVITNGGSTPGLWRTLTKEEWNYVFNEREASTIGMIEDARYVKATVINGASVVKGVILFPDEYENPSGININSSTINKHDINFDVNEYSVPQWQEMEDKGCVFFPITGYRNGTLIYELEKGYYWSSSKSGSSTGTGVRFDESDLRANFGTSVILGESVRLVHDYR